MATTEVGLPPPAAPAAAPAPRPLPPPPPPPPPEPEPEPEPELETATSPYLFYFPPPPPEPPKPDRTKAFSIAVMIGVVVVVALFAGFTYLTRDTSTSPQTAEEEVAAGGRVGTAGASTTTSSSVPDSSSTTVAADDGAAPTSSVPGGNQGVAPRAAQGPGSARAPEAATGGAVAPPADSDELIQLFVDRQVPFALLVPADSWTDLLVEPPGLASGALSSPEPDARGFLGLAEVDLFSSASAASSYAGQAKQSNDLLVQTLKITGITGQAQVIQCGPVVVSLVSAAEPGSGSAVAADVGRFVADSVPAVRAALAERYGSC